MFAKMENDYGTIAVNGDVIAKIAGDAAAECDGVVGMAMKNVKDGLVHLLKAESFYKGIIVKEDEIEIHIIVEYGCNITKTANDVIGKVRYRIEEMTGIEIDCVNVFVEGIRKGK